MIVHMKDGRRVGDENFRVLFEMKGGNIALQQRHNGFSTGMGISLDEVKSIAICGIIFVPEQGKK